MTDQIGGNRTLNINQDDNSDPDPDFTVVTSKDQIENIDRKVLPSDVREWGRQRNNVLMWETDPKTLRDYAENSIVQAFIDTLAKDVSSIEWDVIDNSADEQAEEVKEFLTQAHPQKTFRDVLESTVRDLLELGNAFWVIHRYEDSDEPAEIVVPDASTMFKVVDDDGFLEGYAQKHSNNKSEVIPKKDVVQFQWSSASDRNYARSPVETTMDQIDIIEELLLKEQLDLTEGGVSSIISQTDDHETNPLSSKEWKKIKNQVTQQEGARHVNVITRGSFERTQIGTNYDEMNILERYKTHIQTISSAFKIPASYAGLDYENTNRATDQNQTENYRQKGIKIAIQQIKTRINKDLMPQIEEGTEFTWNIETEQDLQDVEYYTQLSEAVMGLQEAGVPFEVSNNQISIPEGAEVTMNELQQVEEANMLAELSDKDIEEVIATKPPEVEECVESVLEDNPDMSKAEAYAICQEQNSDEKEDEPWKELNDPENLTERKEQLVKALGVDSFSHAVWLLEDDNDKRSDAFDEASELLDGMSKSTYYSWLEEVGLKD